MNIKNIEILEVDGIDMRDYPDFCDAYISNAQWIDTGIELTEDELIELGMEHGDLVYEEVIKRVF